MAWRPIIRPTNARAALRDSFPYPVVAIHRVGLCGRPSPRNARCMVTQTKYVHAAPAWRPSVALDEWVARDAKPISLRQLTYFGRTLTEARLLSSANYVRTELPTRLAHRLRDMQTLPYVVLSNPHLSHAYELYYKAFERFRRVPEILTLDDNDRYCSIIKEMLELHLSVIPRLAIGVLEVQGLMSADALDRFMRTLLKSRISRRVICEQHLALTETFHSPWHFPDAVAEHSAGGGGGESESVGEIFLRCNGREIVEKCAGSTSQVMRAAYGDDCPLPQIRIVGEPEATFPYIQSHLEYIIGELLRNSMQALAEQSKKTGRKPEDIEVLICETPQHVLFRFSDCGGGIPRDVLPHLWSFSKGPRRHEKLKNLSRVPRMAATMSELATPSDASTFANLNYSTPIRTSEDNKPRNSSLSSLTGRPPNLRLGIGLPMSRIYAEYWAGELEIHSLEGYGTDAFLSISKLGNRNESLSTRALMDSV